MLLVLHVTAQGPSSIAKKDYEVAVYYFPNYHPDSINARWHGKGWTEWEVVKAAKPRFPGHEQPKIPSWGYFNEADPAWAAKEIDLAADNGNGLGGIEAAKKAIQLLDEKTRKAGFPGVHLNIMSWMVNDEAVKAIVGPGAPATAKKMLKDLGDPSVSTYCYVHHYTNLGTDGFPTVPVEKAFASATAYWKKFTAAYPDILYTPNVSMGWDASPRCMQSDRFELHNYPWTPVFVGNTPAAFQQQLQAAKSFLDGYNPRHKILVLNSWNEWTEGSYLLPEKNM